VTGQALTLALPPGRAADALAQLCERLTAMLDRPVRALRATSYDDLLALLERGHAQVAWMSPLLAALAEDRLPLRPLLVTSRGGQVEYRAALFAHAHSSMHTLEDVEATSVAWVDRASGSGYLVPRLMLACAGHDLHKMFAEELFVGSHEEVVRAVCDGRAAVGATYADAAPLAPFGAGRAAVRPLLFSDPIPNDLIMAHGLVPLGDAMSFAAALHAVAMTPPGRALLADVFGAGGFDFTDGTHLASIRDKIQLARRLGLLLQM
jgi:phosphonate transport system substrate-binding protein